MVKFISISFAILCASCSMMVDEKGDVEDAGYSTPSETSTEIEGTSVDSSDTSNDTLGNSDSLTYSDTVSATTQDDTGSVSDTYVVHDTETTTYPECDPSFGPCCDETGHFRGKDFVCNANTGILLCDMLCGKKVNYYNGVISCTGLSSACKPDAQYSNVSDLKEVLIGLECKNVGEKCADSSGNTFGYTYDVNGNVDNSEDHDGCKYFVDPAVSGCGIY